MDTFEYNQIGISLCPIYNLLQSISEEPLIIRIEKNKILTCCLPNTNVTCHRESLIFLMNNSYLPMFCSQFITQLSTAIGAAIIYQNHLNILVGLAKH